MKIITSSVRLFKIALLFYFQIVMAETSDLEYRIKAGYIYNFTKFIFWPKDNSDTFNLCLLGKDPFGKLIDPISSKYSLNRPIVVIRIQQLKYGHECHILFVVSDEISPNDPVIANGKYKTLTIGDYEKFAAKGGMIGFVNKDNKIRLQINLETVKMSGLGISAKILEVAEIIQGRKP